MFRMQNTCISLHIVSYLNISSLCHLDNHMKMSYTNCYKTYFVKNHFKYMRNIEKYKWKKTVFFFFEIFAKESCKVF